MKEIHRICPVFHPIQSIAYSCGERTLKSLHPPQTTRCTSFTPFTSFTRSRTVVSAVWHETKDFSSSHLHRHSLATTLNCTLWTMDFISDYYSGRWWCEECSILVLLLYCCYRYILAMFLLRNCRTVGGKSNCQFVLNPRSRYKSPIKHFVHYFVPNNRVYSTYLPVARNARKRISFQQDKHSTHACILRRRTRVTRKSVISVGWRFNQQIYKIRYTNRVLSFDERSEKLSWDSRDRRTKMKDNIKDITSC